MVNSFDAMIFIIINLYLLNRYKCVCLKTKQKTNKKIQKKVVKAFKQETLI